MKAPAPVFGLWSSYTHKAIELFTSSSQVNKPDVN